MARMLKLLMLLGQDSNYLHLERAIIFMDFNQTKAKRDEGN